jgi:hypothetical protein
MAWYGPPEQTHEVFGKNKALKRKEFRSFGKTK